MPRRGPLAEVPVAARSGGKVRISRAVRDAVALMVFHGKSRAEAAEAVKLQDDSLYRALRKPEVLSYRHELMKHKRGEEASRSLERVAKLADASNSDHVKLQASQFLLSLDGYRATEHVVHDHTHKIVPGYVLDPSGPDLTKPPHLEGKARDVTPATADEGGGS